MTLTHVCGERFDVGNGNMVDVTVRYAVAGSAESGDLTLAAGASGGAAGVTRLVTLTAGSVDLSYQGQPVATVPEPAASVSEWGAPFAWPVVAVPFICCPMAACSPGHYMLFLLDADGIPSVARIIRIG